MPLGWLNQSLRIRTWTLVLSKWRRSWGRQAFLNLPRYISSFFLSFLFIHYSIADDFSICRHRSSWRRCKIGALPKKGWLPIFINAMGPWPTSKSNTRRPFVLSKGGEGAKGEAGREGHQKKKEQEAKVTVEKELTALLRQAKTARADAVKE